MATFLEMTNEIADDFVNESVTSSQIKDAINRAIAHYARRHFYFNETVATFSTVASQEYYDAADFADIPYIAEIIAMKATLSGSKLDLVPVDWAVIDAVQTGGAVSFPSNYAYFRQKIRLYPVPDAAYTVTIAYVSKLAELSADGDENAWTTEGYDLIKDRAKWNLAKNKLHAADLAQEAKAGEIDALSEIMAETRRRRTGKRLVMPELTQPAAYNIEVDR